MCEIENYQIRKSLVNERDVLSYTQSHPQLIANDFCPK